MNPKPLVLYHANCPDGFCAAWVARKYLGDCDFIPVQYGEDPPDVEGRDLYILDFSYKRPVMEKLVKDAGEILVLDHHKTAEVELRGLSEFVTENSSTPHRFVFDMGKSGGRLTWEQFFGTEPSPWLVNYTEDRDLWRWQLPASREVNAALASYPRTFEQWDILNTFPTPLDTLAREGSAILRFQNQLVESICSTAREVELGGHKVLAANTCVMISEVAGKLSEGKPFGACWFIRSDGKKQWSLRSRDGGMDVSIIAKGYGGGGHRNASGFEE